MIDFLKLQSGISDNYKLAIRNSEPPGDLAHYKNAAARRFGVWKAPDGPI
jgi:hypothetical protein